MSTSAPLDFSRFYELKDPLTNRPLRITVRGYNDWVNSDFAWKLFRGQVSSEQPIQLGGYRGGQVTDFLWSDLVHMVCITDRVVEILGAKEVTGWMTYPVEVYGRKGEPLPGYHGFAVTGSECRRDRSRSQILTRQAVPGENPSMSIKGFTSTKRIGMEVIFSG